MNFFWRRHNNEGFDNLAHVRSVKAFILSVLPARLEPATLSFVVRRSNPLSYGSISVGVVGLEPTMFEDGRFTVSCNSRYATPQCWRKQKDSYSGNRLAFGIIQARLASALSCGDFELSEPFERLGPLAEGWFLSPKAASR